MLKRARARRKLTQVELAKRVGVDEMTISRIERDVRRPSMALLQRLAKALGVPVSELLGRREKRRSRHSNSGRRGNWRRLNARRNRVSRSSGRR